MTLAARIKALPPFRDAPPDFLDEAGQAVVEATLPAGAEVCRQGDLCEMLPIVLKGEARVYSLSESAREITLYRIGPGESCVLTTSCILSQTVFPVFAVTLCETEAVLVPAARVEAWFDRYPHWRRYVFGLVSRRTVDLLSIVEEVAFHRMDERLARLLLARGSAERSLAATHQQIADELGTAREVVSRLLKEFERRGWVSNGRGCVGLLDPPALHALGFPHLERSLPEQGPADPHRPLQGREPNVT